MPAIRRKTKLKRSYNNWHRMQLTFGPDHFQHQGFGFAANDIDGMRKGWSDLGAQIMAACKSTYPGQRPYGWWQFDAPEPLKDGETETQYLERLDLLAEGEKKYLRYKREELGTLSAAIDQFEAEYEATGVVCSSVNATLTQLRNFLSLASADDKPRVYVAQTFEEVRQTLGKVKQDFGKELLK